MDLRPRDAQRAPCQMVREFAETEMASYVMTGDEAHRLVIARQYLEAD